MSGGDARRLAQCGARERGIPGVIQFAQHKDLDWSKEDTKAFEGVVSAYYSKSNTDEVQRWGSIDGNTNEKSNAGLGEMNPSLKVVGVRAHQPHALHLALLSECPWGQFPASVVNTRNEDEEGSSAVYFEHGYTQAELPPKGCYDDKAEDNLIIGRGLHATYKDSDIAEASKVHDALLDAAGPGLRQRAPPVAAGGEADTNRMPNAALGYNETKNLGGYLQRLYEIHATLSFPEPTEHMRHIDIGGGSNITIMLEVFLAFGCVSHSLEFDPVRAYVSTCALHWFLRQLRATRRDSLVRMAGLMEDRLHVYLGDLDLCTPKFYAFYTHLISYDLVFPAFLHTKLARKVLNSPSIEVVATFKKQMCNYNRPGSYVYHHDGNPLIPHALTEANSRDPKKRAFDPHQRRVNGKLYKWTPTLPALEEDGVDEEDETLVPARYEVVLEDDDVEVEWNGEVLSRDVHFTEDDDSYLTLLAQEGILEDPTVLGVGHQMAALDPPGCSVDNGGTTHKIYFLYRVANNQRRLASASAMNPLVVGNNRAAALALKALADGRYAEKEAERSAAAVERRAAEKDAEAAAEGPRAAEDNEDEQEENDETDEVEAAEDNHKDDEDEENETDEAAEDNHNEEDEEREENETRDEAADDNHNDEDEDDEENDEDRGRAAANEKDLPNNTNFRAAADTTRMQQVRMQRGST